MKRTSKFVAAAVAAALAAGTVGCSAPKAITIGGNTRDALTVDDYDIRAGVFIYYELVSVGDAAQKMYDQANTYPSVDDIKKASFEGTPSEDWIQARATDYCKKFVAVEREFDKVGGVLPDDYIKTIKTSVKESKDEDYYKDNGIGETSLREVITNGTGSDSSSSLYRFSKYYYLFKHYYGLDSEFGCTEDQLKEYFTDNYARIKYLSISLTDSEGNKLDGDELRDLNNLVDDYVKEINSAGSDDAKFKKFDDIKTKYETYKEEKAAKEAEEAAKAAAETATGTTTTTTTTTTTATTDPDETTTTTTTDPHANENILMKNTTTAPTVGEITTTPVESDSEKANRLFNEKVFGDLDPYKAVRYDYDENTVYIVIKADMKERMTEDDLWTDTVKDSLIETRYAQDFDDMIKSLGDTYSISKNSKSYKRYAPFKLDLE
ncbi:MAG: hypothetical protein IKO47_09775 [Ruminococcus sp.]|nr:hypothetical protein [Ruminococcus sp.]